MSNQEPIVDIEAIQAELVEARLRIDAAQQEIDALRDMIIPAIAANTLTLEEIIQGLFADAEFRTRLQVAFWGFQVTEGD